MEDKKIFLIGDTHFNHQKIIEYEKRPFKNVEEMDNYLINKWNSVVSDKDEVWIVGDFGFFNSHHKLREILNQLKGNKVFIQGNHDKTTLFSQEAIKLEDYRTYKNILVTHIPIPTEFKNGKWNVHAHSHSKLPFKDNKNHRICVSAEMINYTPISLDEIIKIVSGKEVKDVVIK